jgi:hypothetical protein
MANGSVLERHKPGGRLNDRGQMEMPGTELAPVPAHVVRAEHAEAIRKLRKRAVSDIIEIGNRLIDVRENHCAHGEWLLWLEAEFGWTDRTARNFMAVAEMAGKSEKFADLDIPVSSLYQLASPKNEAARQAVFEAAESGEKLTGAKVNEIIEAVRPKPQLTIVNNEPEEDEEALGELEAVLRAPPVGQFSFSPKKGGERMSDEHENLLKVMGNADRLAEYAPAVSGEDFRTYPLWLDESGFKRGISRLKACRDELDNMLRRIEHD